MSKRILFAALSAAMAFVACNENHVEPLSMEDEHESVRIDVTVSDGMTKISEPMDDKSINSVQVLVFNKHGLFETSSSSSTLPVTVTCTTGEKKIVALVNAGLEENVVDIADLGSRTVNLKDSGAENIVMVGTKDTELTGSGPVTINAERLAAKIVLNSVQLSLPIQFKDISFEINSVYLINAAGDKAYMDANVPSVWYNLGAYDPASSMALLYEDVSDAKIVSGGNPYSTDHYFYCYPNDTDTKTRLVVEAVIEGETYYYPITLDKVESNNLYTYALTITRFGSDSPDKPLEDGAVNFTVHVTAWNENVYDYEI